VAPGRPSEKTGGHRVPIRSGPVPSGPVRATDPPLSAAAIADTPARKAGRTRHGHRLSLPGPSSAGGLDPLPRQVHRRRVRGSPRLGLAPSTVLVRVRSLRERGYVTGFHAAVDLARLGRGVQAMLSVQVRPLSRSVINGFQAWALGLPEVLSVYVLAGDEDFLVHVAVRDVETLHALLVDQFSRRSEVVRFRSSIIYQHSRRRVVPRMAE